MKILTRFLVLFLLAACSLLAADITDHVGAGQTVTLTAAADGNPAPTFEWFRDAVKVADGPSLVIQSFAAANVGAYTVKASNVVGSATSDKYTLTLGTAPTKPTISITVSVTVTSTNITTAQPPTPAAARKQ